MCWMDRDYDLSKILEAGREIRTSKKFQLGRDKFYLLYGTTFQNHLNMVKWSEGME